MSGPGLAVERTVLAWTRTWLSAAVCGLLLLRPAAGSAVRLGVSLGVGGAALAVLAWTGRRRGGWLQARAAASAPMAPAARAAGVTAATVTLLGLAAAALVATR